MMHIANYTIYNVIWVMKIMRLSDDFIAERIAKLRIEKGVSAREMSLAFGQNINYINKIENKQSLPKIRPLEYICEYLGISLSEFFDEGNTQPGRLREVNEELRKLTPAQIDIILSMAREFTKKK